MFGQNNQYGCSNAMNYMTFPGVLKSMTKEEIIKLRKMSQVKVATFIMVQICELSGVALEDARGKKRTREFVKARQMMMYYMDLYADISQPEIGKFVSNGEKFHHTTVLYARDTIKDLLISKSPDEYTVDVKRINKEFITNLKHFILNESNSTDGQSGER
jgi:chromosomal replication initiation ATPase DnaA